MLLAIDAGNTNIVFAIFKDDEVIGQWRVSSDSSRTADEYAVILKELLGLKNIDFGKINGVIISTVVPQNLFELKNLSKRYFDVEPLVVGEKNVRANIKIDVDRVSEVGADRLVNACAAYDKHKKALIIIDFGTATTFDVVSGDGTYLGGLISPGINLSMDALHLAAAKLPEIAIAKPEKVIGRSTVKAMQSGVYFGYIGLIEGIVARVKEEYGDEMKVLATGGLASLFAKGTKVIDHLERDLTIKGLNNIFGATN